MEELGKAEPIGGESIEGGLGLWLSALFERTEGEIDIRWIDPDGDGATTRRARSVDDAERLVRNGDQQRNVSVGIATRRIGSKHGGKDELWEVVALWCDVDLAGAYELPSVEAAIEKLGLPPSMIVRSSGYGLHLYWLLDRPHEVNDTKEIDAALRGLADALGGDPAAAEAAKVMRAPGTTNRMNAKKRAAGREDEPCELISHEPGRRYPWSAFADLIERGRRESVLVSEIEFTGEDFGDSLPPFVETVLGMKKGDGAPRWEKLVARWSGDATDLKDTSPSGWDMAIADNLAMTGARPDEILAALRWRRREEGLTEKHRGALQLTIRKAFSWVESNGVDPEQRRMSTMLESGEAVVGKDGLPVIVVNLDQVREIVADITDAVVEANDPPWLFRRAGGLVRIARGEFGQGVAEPVVKDDYINVLNKGANFMAMKQNGPRNCALPANVCAAAVKQLARDSRIPILRSVTTAPVIRRDGTILDQEGFDAELGAYCAPALGFEMPDVPEAPTAAEAEAALATLREPFSRMKFANLADEANFLLLILTVILRPWFPVVPIAILEATVWGSGKTLLGRCLRALLGLPDSVAFPVKSDNEDEWRKRIFSLAMTGQQVVIFDNMKDQIGGPAIEALATSPVLTDRVLKESRTADAQNVALWAFTSNNAHVTPDMLRRSVFVRLDPDTARPWKTHHPKELMAEVQERRGELVAATMTLVRRWIALGRPASPAGSPRLGSFEAWSNTVPAILHSVGVTAALTDLADREMDMMDDDSADLYQLAATLHEHLPAACEEPGVLVRDIVKAAESAYRMELMVAANGVILPAGMLQKGAPTATKMLGRWLSNRRDRWVEVDGVEYRIRPSKQQTAGEAKRQGRRWVVDRREARAGKAGEG